MPNQLSLAEQARFEAFFQRGTELLLNHQPSEALELLFQAHTLNPNHPDAALNLSGAYILSNKFSKAVPILENLRDLDPHNPRIWQNLGAAYLGNPILATDERQLKAIWAFKRAIELDPQTAHVAYNLGLIYRDRQEMDEAAHWFQRAWQINPHDQDAYRLWQQLSRADS